MANLSITAANVDPGANAIKGTGEAGATITAGQVVYLDPTNNKVKPAINNSTTPANVIGVALVGSSNNQPVIYQIIGDIDLGATLTVGEIYVLGNVAGSISPEADNGSGEFVTILGVATAADTLKMRIHASGVSVP